VIVNPHAHRVRRSNGLVDELRRTVGAEGEVVATQTEAELDEAVDRFVRLDYGVVATCGGDGTNLSTITRLVGRAGPERLPRLSFLRGGTVNTVAKNLGIEGEPAEILGRLARRVRRGEPLPEVGQDLIEVNGMHGFLFASAMGSRFLEAYYGGGAKGAPWATLLALRIVGSCLVQGRYARWLFAPLQVELSVDGEPLGAMPARLLLASVVPDVGIGMRVAWQAGRQPHRFHLVASALSTPSMALQMPRVLTGRPLQGAPHVDRLASTVELRFPAGAESYTLDGELFRAERVRIRSGPRIRVVKP
jgi:diacylglycerol kinase family enzyme